MVKRRRSPPSLERGWVLWVRPQLPVETRWTGPRDYVSPYRDGGPGEFGAVVAIAAAVAWELRAVVYLVRIQKVGPGWRVSHVYDLPIDPMALDPDQARALLPAWLVDQLQAGAWRREWLARRQARDAARLR